MAIPLALECDEWSSDENREKHNEHRRKMFQYHAAGRFLRPAATDFASTSRIPTTASCPPSTLRTFLSTISDSNDRRAFATCRPRPSTTADVRSTSGISRKEAREGSLVVLVDFLFMTCSAPSADESEYSAIQAFRIDDAKDPICPRNGDFNPPHKSSEKEPQSASMLTLRSVRAKRSTR